MIGFAMLRQRNLYHHIIFLSTKQNADSRILKILLFVAVVIIYIHLQLSNILVGELLGLYLDNYKALQKPVVEKKVNKKLVALNMQAFLPSA